MNTLHFGDNLHVITDHIEDQSIDLIYLDPPFNSKANYNVLFEEEPGTGSLSQVTAFHDTWKWGEKAAIAYDEIMETGSDAAVALAGLERWIGKNDLLAYLSMMTLRLIYLHSKLKKTGSLYLHCDPTAGAYLRIILESIFGQKGFRNEIAWCYNKWSIGARQFARNHDTILFYSKGDTWTFNVQFVDPSPGTQKRWKGKKQQALFDEDGRRLASASEDEARSPCPDWWPISILNPNASERLGYPTQKPLTLLERIILASSNPGDVVFDPFCGCGTTIEAAEKHGRRWIGADVTHYAITVIEERLARHQPNAIYEVRGRPESLRDARALAAIDKHQFEWWAAWMLKAQAYTERKRGPDRGIDGRIRFQNGPYGFGNIIISVKGGENVGVGMVKELIGTIDVEDAEMGVLVLLNQPTKNMVQAAHAAGFVKNTAHGRLPRIQIVTVEQLLEGQQPIFPPLPKTERQVMPSVKTKRDQLELMLTFSDEKVPAPKAKKKGAFVDPRYRAFG